MQAQNTQSQMNSNRATLDKHYRTCSECHRSVDKTQTSLASCQLHSPSSSKATASIKPENAIRSHFSPRLDYPICLDKNDQTTHPDTMIPSEQVNLLTVSVPNSTEDKPKQCTDIVIIDSSSDEEELANRYCANLQQKKPTKKSTMYPKYKGFSDQEHVNSDTDTALSRTKEGRTKHNKRKPSSDYLLGYVEHKTQKGIRLLVPCSSDEDENYYPTRKERYQEESSTQSKRITYTGDRKDPSYKLNDSDTEVVTPPFSPIKKTSASATLSLSRAHKKPLHMIGPSNTASSRVDAAPRTARKPKKRSPKSPCRQELPLSPPNSVFGTNHTIAQASTSTGIPKSRIKLNSTGAPEKIYMPVNQESSTATHSSKASTKLNTAAVSAKRPLAPKQKTPVTPGVKLNHCPAESSSKKPLPAKQGPNTSPRPGNPPPKPKASSTWQPLNITQEPSPAQSKRNASGTRRARAEPYAAATHQRRSPDTIPQETRISSHENDSGHLSSQQRRSFENNPSASKIESALSSVTHEVITLSSDEPSEPIIKPKKRAPKRKSSLLTESSESILFGSEQSQETDDGVVVPRFKIRKKTVPLKVTTKEVVSSTAPKRKASCLIDPADAPHRKAAKKSPPPDLCVSSSVPAANKRTLRKRTPRSYNIEFDADRASIPEDVSEKETVVLETSASAFEEEINVDEENKEEANDHEEDGFVSYLQMMKDDPVAGAFILDKDALTVSGKVLGDGQVGAVYAGTYDGVPVACKTMAKGVDEENFYFQVFKEIIFAQKLVHCRNMIKYYGWAHYEGNGSGEKEKFFLAQRLIDNGDARKYLFKRRTFSPKEVLLAGTCLFSALADAHAADIGMVDLKLENYLIDDSGSGYLTDFGSCVEFFGRNSVNLLDEEVSWTKAVAAPEMVRSKQFSKASDVFMGTLMLAELTTGQLSDAEFKTKVLRRKAGGAVDFTVKAINPCYDFLFPLMADGLDTVASNRPTANQMLIKLEKLKNEGLVEA